MSRRPPAARPPAPAARAPGAVRIIGGHWRGTRLPVPDRPGLRPTADRVRETLFNWLQPMLPGAKVLDLFAGSGALGVEAGSRGAAEVVLVERDPGLADALRTLAARLPGGERLRVVRADALAWLAAPPQTRFDLVLLDPPFAGDARGWLWAPALAALTPWLAEDAWLYLESPRLESPQPENPEHAAIDPGPGWRLHREGHTRDVRYALYRRRIAADFADIAADIAAQTTAADAPDARRDA